MTRGEIGLAQEGRWGGRATNEENNTGRERERDKRRGEEKVEEGRVERSMKGVKEREREKGRVWVLTKVS